MEKKKKTEEKRNNHTIPVVDLTLFVRRDE